MYCKVRVRKRLDGAPARTGASVSPAGLSVLRKSQRGGRTPREDGRAVKGPPPTNQILPDLRRRCILAAPKPREAKSHAHPLPGFALSRYLSEVHLLAVLGGRRRSSGPRPGPERLHASSGVDRGSG